MKKIVRKSIFLFILIILLVVQLFARKEDSRYDLEGNKNFEDIRVEYAKNFITLITYEQYELAYDMLTDDCKKELADNDIEKFKNIMKTKVYSYGNIPKTFNYDEVDSEPVEKDGKMIYSQKVYISHASLGRYTFSEDEMKDVYEYIKVVMINFIIYEEGPYNYKLSIQLVEN